MTHTASRPTRSARPAGAPPGPTLRDAWELRRPERHLLLWSLACLALGFVMVLGSGQAASHPITPWPLLPLLGFAISLLILHVSLVWWRFRGDQILLGSVVFLSALGLLAQYPDDTVVNDIRYHLRGSPGSTHKLNNNGINLLMITCDTLVAEPTRVRPEIIGLTQYQL